MLYKWNPNFNQPDYVATGKAYVSSNDTSYHCITGTFLYHPPFTASGNPDTACVYITSSMDTTEGNIIKVDGIYFGANCNPTEAIQISGNAQAAVYPNPAANVISFTNLPAGADRIKLFEISGKMVAAEAVSRAYVDMDVKNLEPGIYFYAIYDDNNKRVMSGKISVAH